MKRVFSFVLALIFAVSMASGIFGAVSAKAQARNMEIAKKNALTETSDFADDEEVTIMVKLSDDCAEKAGVKDKDAIAYQDKLLGKQNKVKKSIEKLLKKEISVKTNYTRLFNGFAFVGTPDMVKKINALDGVVAFVAPVFELPQMIASTELINAPEMWELGYTGKGQKIAILDTGIRKTHEAFSVEPEGTENGSAEKYYKDLYEEYGEYMHSFYDEDLYYNGKVPFMFNYYHTAVGAEHHSSDHGTHVAATAAGNNGNGFKGVAYDAQLYAMNVFADNGGASWDVIIQAIEDCLYLDVDTINMSLGAAAGVTTYAEEAYTEIFDMVENAGIAVAASAGNEGSTATGNAWSEYQLANNPDSGVVGSPSTWPACMSVASSDNATVCAGSIKVGNEQIAYADPFKDTDMAFNTISGKYDYVLCGFGAVEDFDGKKVEGKVAVISRGTTTFTEKVANAIANGAVAAVIYNNQEGVINMSVESTIPAVSVLQTAGEVFKNNADKDGYGKLEIVDGIFIDYTPANVISSFSSVGSTPDLAIKPEITAPGGNITSAIGLSEDNSYATWSGTSMSSPHIAGAIAVIKQYVEDRYPNALDRENLEMAYDILMSTAMPLEGELVRSQGAGLVNLQAAVTTNAYLTSMEGTRPKLELGENDEGKFELQFKVENMGNKDITYEISTNALIDCPYLYGTVDDKPVYVTGFDALDVTEDCVITGNNSITVKADKTATVKVTLAVGEELLGDIHEIFENGTYLEGYVTLTPKATTEGVKEATLSIPYLGFVGDWDKAAVIDYGYYWQEATGQMNWTSNGAIPYAYIGSDSDGELLYGAGINPYGDGSMPTFSYDRVAVNPEIRPVDYILFSLLRTPKTLNMHVEDKWGNILYYMYESEEYQWRKEFQPDGGTYSYSDMTFEVDYDSMAENETVYIVLETNLAHEGFAAKDNDNCVWRVPVTLDTIAPYVTKYEYKDKALSLDIFDTQYIAAVKVFADKNYTEELASELFYAQTRANAEKFKVDVDTKINPLLYFAVCDYAGNERHYIFNSTDNTFTEDINMMGKTNAVDIFADGFENDATLENWDTIDADGDKDEWTVLEAAGYESEGKRFAASFSWDETTEQPLTPDNWIITPNIEIPSDGNTYYISYDIAATGYEETYEFLYGPADAKTSDMFTSVGTEQISGEQYQTVEIDVTALAGQTVRFAWRHYDCTDGYCVRLDNIHVYYNESIGAGEEVYACDYEQDNTWKTFDADGDGKTFQRVDNEGLANGGKFAMFSASFDTATWKNIDADNWAVSPKISVPESPDISYLSYDVISMMDMHDYYEVYIGTSQDYKKMTTLLYAGEASGEWTRETLNISAYAGKDVYIAFRHVCDDGMILGIDNVNVNMYEQENEYMVTFVSGYDNKVIGMSRFAEGSIISGFPTAPEYEDKAFAYWNYDNKPVTKETSVKAMYEIRGDVNSDKKLNTGDATILLKLLAATDETSCAFTEIQWNVSDFNMDMRVNTGDAVAILRYVAQH